MLDIFGLINLMFTFFQNNEWLVTVLVGFIAYFIYKKTQADYKRNVAQLILQEIRYAEQQIRVARDHQHVYSLANKLLPTNSWSKNIHLFVGDLEEADIDFISGFYSKTMYIDGLIEFISNYKCSKEIIINSNNQNNQFIPLPPNAPIAAQGMQNNQFIPLPPNAPIASQGVNQQQNLIIQSDAENILKNVSTNIEFIYNTPTIDKLRCIAKKKWQKMF